MSSEYKTRYTVPAGYSLRSLHGCQLSESERSPPARLMAWISNQTGGQPASDSKVSFDLAEHGGKDSAQILHTMMGRGSLRLKPQLDRCMELLAKGGRDSSRVKSTEASDAMVSLPRSRGMRASSWGPS
jgi:hypothetical protein